MALQVQTPTEIVFDLEQTPDYRVIAVDGVIGSIAPTGKSLHMSIYNESAKLPRTMVNSIENGQLGAELVERREGGNVITRRVEATLVLTPESAVALRDWLNLRLVEFEEATAYIKSMTER